MTGVVPVTGGTTDVGHAVPLFRPFAGLVDSADITDAPGRHVQTG